jgi:hypothetical protein
MSFSRIAHVFAPGAFGTVAMLAGLSFGQSFAWPTLRHDNQRSGRSPVIASQIDVPRFPTNFLTCCSASVPSTPVANDQGIVYLSTHDTLWTINGLRQLQRLQCGPRWQLHCWSW